MSDDNDGRASMAATNAAYRTVNTVFTKAAAEAEIILKADPRRLYVRFQPDNAVAINAMVLPEPRLTVAFTPTSPIVFGEAKWKDHPSIATGAWFVYGGIGDVWLATECLYVGED